MKISITLALVLLITAFLIIPSLMLVVFFRLPNKKSMSGEKQHKQKSFDKNQKQKKSYDLKMQGDNFEIKNVKNQRALKITAYICFVLYLLFLFVLVFGQVNVEEGYVAVNIVKNSNWFSLNFATAHANKTNLLYNLIMMFPVSAFVFATQKVDKSHNALKYFLKVFLKTVLISFLISLFIETFQFILPVKRTTELFDLLINTLSGVLGFCYFWPLILICNKLHHKEPRQVQ